MTGPPTEPPTEPPTGAGIEAAVLRMWTELGLRPTSTADDFFAAGGQSLTLVRFLARVQEAYGVELPVDRLFDEDLTAVVAARLITEARLTAAQPSAVQLSAVQLDEARLIDEADEGDLAAILAEVEGLSADELAALLAEAE